MSSYEGDVVFIFNGVQYTLKAKASMTEQELLNEIVTLLKPDFGESHIFKVIDNNLWIVGKSIETPVITPMWEINEKTSSYRFQVVYQNLGYNITLKDTDGKNFIDVPLYNSGIDPEDDGKTVRFGDVITVLRTFKANRKAELTFRDRPVLKNSFKWLYNDMFFACGNGGTMSTNELLTEIVNLCYSDRAIVNGNTLILKDADKEYGFFTTGNTWYSTYNKHVADYKFVTENGIEYDPVKGTFNNVGSSSNRPESPLVGFQFFDTTLGIPVFWNGSMWVDSEGKRR
jgi:hypothetical protein